MAMVGVSQQRRPSLMFATAPPSPGRRVPITWAHSPYSRRVTLGELGLLVPQFRRIDIRHPAGGVQQLSVREGHIRVLVPRCVVFAHCPSKQLPNYSLSPRKTSYVMPCKPLC